MNKQAVVFPYYGFTRMVHKRNFRMMEIFYVFMVEVVVSPLTYKFVRNP